MRKTPSCGPEKQYYNIEVMNKHADHVV